MIEPAEDEVLKAVLLIAVVIGILCFWGSLCRRNASARMKAPLGSERVVACAVCRMHIPESEALHAAGQYYCCEEHRKLADGRQSG